MLKKISKIILKTFLWIVGIFLALDILIVTLIFIPPVQQFVVLKVSKLLTDITGGEITVDRIYLSPALTLTAKNFAIKDHHYENMIFASTLKGRINFGRSGKAQVCLSFAELDEGEVVIRKYAGEDAVNIAIWAKGFKKEVKKEPKFKLLFENIKLNDVRFVFINDDKRLYKTDNSIDYAFFELQHIHLNVADFLVFGADISCKINSLTLSQHTGFEISSFTSSFRIYNEGLILDSLKFTTPNSTFSGNFAFRYHDFKDYADFVNLINFDTQIKSASIDMKDVIYFVPALDGMYNKAVVSGYVGGTVNHLETQDIYLKYNLQTRFTGDFAIHNTLNPQSRSFDIKFRDANVNFSELAHFKLPKGKNITLPPILDKLAYSRIKGYFKGSFTKFNTELNINTNLGAAETKINMSQKGKTISYTGTLACKDVEIGKIIHQTKYLNKINLRATLEGESPSTGKIKEFITSASVRFRGRVTHLDICEYPFSELLFRGSYTKQHLDLSFKSTDSLALFTAKGDLDFSKHKTLLTASVSNVKIKLNELFSCYNHRIDTASANGVEILISKIQQTPQLVFTLDSISVTGYGTQFEDFNGFAGINNAKLSNTERTSRIDWFRLNAINLATLPHQYQIRSNAFNATLKTNYNLKELFAALHNAVHFYLPEMFTVNGKFAETKEMEILHNNPFIDIDLQFYYTRNLFNLILPQLNIARDASVNLHLGKSRNEDVVSLFFPLIAYTETGSVNNLKVNGKMNKNERFEMTLHCDSLKIYQKKNKNNLTFSTIDLQTNSNQKEIQFASSWKNPKVISINELNKFTGTITGSSLQDFALKITDSKLFLRESLWNFTGNHNTIHFGDKRYLFDHCILSSQIGKISIDGEISPYFNNECNILLEDFDISLLNSLTAKKKMTFGGEMSLMATISTNEERFVVDGKTFVKDFVFNEEHLGNLFLDATMFTAEAPRFIGGILSDKEKAPVNLAKYSYLNYLASPNRIVELEGNYFPKNRELRVHANIDTLKIGFLSPFLASFSDIISGYAAGTLDFVMNRDSLYFDGKVKVKHAQMGIAPLNTVYYIADQEILFNWEGIKFEKVEILDKFKNKAILSGFVNHNKFKDFKINLNISTPRILAMNTPKKVDASFYGDGFVSGDISIQGDSAQLNFQGHNLKTQSGSSIVFPLSSAGSVSSTQGIYFVQSEKNKNRNVEKNNQLSTALNFDFIFEVTRDADVRLDLDPIDGVLRCNTAGRLRLAYNTHTGNLNIGGLLEIVNGRFHMSLKNLFQRDFTIVEGGTIMFSGPLTSAQINVRALYQKAASLSSLSNELKDIGRTDVSAYLGLNGNLMNPNPSFTFDFPRLPSGEQNRIFTVLDTANTQNGIRQFFSFVFLNTFITETSVADINAKQQTIGTGIDFASGILNSFISNQLNNLSIGVNYVNDENNYKEYSLNAEYHFVNDRLSVKTNFGYAQNANNPEQSNNLIGDVEMNVKINPKGKGNLLFRAFYFNDKTGTTEQKPQQGGGIGLTFKQGFNTRKDFLENWKPKQKTKKKKNSSSNP